MPQASRRQPLTVEGPSDLTFDILVRAWRREIGQQVLSEKLNHLAARTNGNVGRCVEANRTHHSLPHPKNLRLLHAAPCLPEQLVVFYAILWGRSWFCGVEPRRPQQHGNASRLGRVVVVAMLLIISIGDDVHRTASVDEQSGARSVSQSEGGYRPTKPGACRYPEGASGRQCRFDGSECSESTYSVTYYWPSANRY